MKNTCRKHNCMVSIKSSGKFNYGTGKILDNGTFETPCTICKEFSRWSDMKTDEEVTKMRENDYGEFEKIKKIAEKVFDGEAKASLINAEIMKASNNDLLALYISRKEFESKGKEILGYEYEQWIFDFLAMGTRAVRTWLVDGI